MIQAAEYKSSAEMLASYKATRERLMGSGVKTRPANENAQVVKLEGNEDYSLPVHRERIFVGPDKDDERHEAIDKFHKWAKTEAAARSPKLFVVRGCKAYGIPYEVMRSESRTRAVYKVRKTLMLMVRQKFPGITLSNIGRLFNRDHSSVSTVLGKVGRKEFNRLTPEQVKEIKKRTIRGELHKHIAPDYGVSVFTVSRIASGERQ